MDFPKVSVIVPVYNTEKYLRKCLDSLINQTLQELEVVIVNDGSSDNSPAIVEEYLVKYPNRIVYESQKNSGQAVARNRAFNLCKGEYIGFLDSDDFVQLDMFEQLYTKAKETGADYVACGYTDLTYEDDQEIELQHYVASKPARKTKDMFFGALASPFLHLYKRNVIMDSGVRFPEGVIYEDTAFYLNLIPYVKKPELIEAPLAYRVRHSNSTMTTFKAEKVEQIFNVLDDILAHYKEKDFIDQYKDEVEYFCVRVLLCSSLQRIAKVGNWSEYRRLVYKTLKYINEHFKDYRKNPYFKGGGQNIYMKCFCRGTAMMLAGLLRIKGRMERQYS